MKNNRTNVLKVLIIIGFLILSGLGMTIGTAMKDSGIETPMLAEAEATSSPRGEARQAPMVEADDYPAFNSFVGNDSVYFHVNLTSLHVDDHNDTNGDNVLYDIEVLGTDADAQAGNLQKYDFTNRNYVDVATPVFSWVQKRIVPDSNDVNDDFLYTRGDPAMGNWKYVVNQENSWLDEDNDGTIDADEYWAYRNWE
jgi:hypothetical protein